MINTLDFYQSLINRQIDFFAGVPDSLLANLCACIKENTPTKKNIITANEGNAVAMCAGYHISTGKYGVVYMQNSGEGNAVNPLLSLADDDVYSIPMLLIIGWRGEPGKHDEPQHVKQGKVTLALLESIGIDYLVLDENSFLEQIDHAINYFKSNSKPFAIIVKKGMFSEYKVAKEHSPFSMTREDALKVILESLGSDDIVVSTTGKTSREIFEIREANKQGHSNDFLTVGSMGHTASIAFGMCQGTDHNVWCIDGDGSFIMHMGSLGVIAANMPNNLKYIINDNAAHESVGGQPTCSRNLNLPMILKGLGFRDAIVAETKEQIANGLEILKNECAVALIIRTQQGSRDNLGRPTTTPKENKFDLMKKLGSLK